MVGQIWNAGGVKPAEIRVWYFCSDQNHSLKKYKEVTDTEKSGIIESPDIIIHKSVGAKIFNYIVRLPNGESQV